MARFYPAVSKNAVPETRRSFKISQSARRQKAAKVRLKTAHENDVKMTPPVDPAASSQASAEKCLLVMRQGLDFDGELLDRCFEFGFDLPAFFDRRGVAEFGTQFVDVLMGRHLFVSLTFVKDDRRGCEGRRRVKVASATGGAGVRRCRFCGAQAQAKLEGPATLRRLFRSRHNGGSEQTGFGLVGTGRRFDILRETLHG
jgi:hypothetical protein